MATTSGNNITAADYNALFTTLESIRAKHAARKEARNTTQLNDRTLGGYKVTKRSGDSARASDVTSVRNALNFLGNYAVDLTTTFASNIRVPNVGDLIKATSISDVNTQITAADRECAFCSFFSSFQSSYRSSYRSSYFSSYDSGYNSSNFGSFNSSWNGVFC